jgi:osmotically-inducible protein OsmY
MLMTRDDDLVRQVRHALTRSGYVELRSVEVTGVRDGIQLNGHVRTYYLKQMAQALAMQIEGVNCMENQMEVR